LTVTFQTYFRASSYAMVAVAMLALVWAGALHLILGLPFAIVMLLAWRSEGTRWQISERTGLILVLLSIPVFYLDWTYQSHLRVVINGELETNALVSAIAHLIVFLSVIKLLQVKADRDWVFLYLISFFEVLLAAGLSFSPIFLVSLAVYLVCGLSTVIAFEIHKARRALIPVETRLLVAHEALLFRRARQRRAKRNAEIRRLPIISVAFLFLIAVLALPLFLVAPRAGAAAFARKGAGLTNFVGFSENIQLGEIGSLKENSQVVLHARVEESSDAVKPELRWRGVVLDEFTGTSWKKSAEARRYEQRTSERGVYQLGTTEALHHLTTQTIFLEPIDTPALFAAPRVIALQGPFSYLQIDSNGSPVDNNGSLRSRRHEFERLIYKAVSDTTEPDVAVLRRDQSPYPPSFDRYLQLPATVDPRIAELATTMILQRRARNRYDAAKAIESQLSTNYAYSLDMKASGKDPLADFLFNVRAGHCEYFSTAMTVMLRTQGVAARVVNGFLSGEYNDAAGAYTVRQSDAHSWVEVYFPATNSWVTFDPTPPAGRAEPQRTGLAGWFGKYAEALELMWFQYVVGYDKQEQRSLATSLNNKLFSYRLTLTRVVNQLQQAPRLLLGRSLYLVILAALIVVGWLVGRRIKGFGWRRGLLSGRTKDESGRSAVEFYERLSRALAEHGLKRASNQTPLEFAAACERREVLVITNAYNRVRFGGDDLTRQEATEIDSWLRMLEQKGISDRGPGGHSSTPRKKG
jgi:protein-glutamine gamma-glutamyltransferase